MLKRLCMSFLCALCASCSTLGQAADWMTVEQPAPERPSIRLCAPPPQEPTPAPGAGWIDPAGLPSVQRTAALMAERWLADFVAWGRQGWDIIEAERAARCEASTAAKASMAAIQPKVR